LLTYTIWLLPVWYPIYKEVFALVPYTLIRSNRRTMAIHILSNAHVEVRVPKTCSSASIENFVRDKEPWILRKLEMIQRQHVEPRPLQPGDTLPYQGNEFPLYPSKDSKTFFDGNAFYFPAALLSQDTDNEILKGALIPLYKQLTLPLVTKQAALYGALLNACPSAIKVSMAVRRWGSCSGKSSLNFSWMLAAADPRGLDYVVVHELCHIQELNQSDEFWRLVKSTLPDYTQRQALLRETAKRLQAWR
jgi:predicted metal-dependent hydrolase